MGEIVKLKPGVAKQLLDAVFSSDCPFCEEEPEIFATGIFHSCSVTGTIFRMTLKSWNSRPGDEVDCPVCADIEKRVKAARVEGMKLIQDHVWHPEMIDAQRRYLHHEINKLIEAANAD